MIFLQVRSLKDGILGILRPRQSSKGMVIGIWESRHH